VIHILSLNYEYPPIGGGGGNAHQQILRCFAEYPDLELTLITTTPQKKVYQESYSENVRIHFLPLAKESFHYWKRGEVVQYLKQHSKYVNEHLQNHSYDLCHVFFGFPSGWIAYRHRKRFPYLISVRGSDVPGYNQRFGLDYLLLSPILKRIYKHASAVVSNSEGLKNLFESQYPKLSAQVIPNGIDVERFHPIEKQNYIPKMVTIARLIPRKGIDVLINACGKLAKANVPFELHILGEGPEMQNLKKLSQTYGISDRVQFHGRIERDRIAQFLPYCNLFVLPSHAEGMSNAALEAMACGLPLVLTDTGGSKELIKENGVVVPKANVEALTQTLKDLLTTPERLKLMGELSRHHAQRFSWKSVAQQYYDLYYEILKQKSANIVTQ